MGDYLSSNQSFIHLDGDEAMSDTSPEQLEVTRKLITAFHTWFKGESCEEGLWKPYFDGVCTRVVDTAIANPTKNIVVTLANYREETREHCRTSVTSRLGDTSTVFRFIHLHVSPRGYAERQIKRWVEYSKIQGWTLQHFWDDVKKQADKFVDEATCVEVLIHEKDTSLSGFVPLDLEAHPEDVMIDTSNAHKGLIEKLHDVLSLGPVTADVYSEAFVKEIADCSYARMEAKKEQLKVVHKNGGSASDGVQVEEEKVEEVEKKE